MVLSVNNRILTVTRCASFLNLGKESILLIFPLKLEQKSVYNVLPAVNAENTQY